MARAHRSLREKLSAHVDTMLKDTQLPISQALREGLQKWKEIHVNRAKIDEISKVSDSLVQMITAEKDKVPALQFFYEHRDAFPVLSHWVFGGDGWAYDIGQLTRAKTSHCLTGFPFSLFCIALFSFPPFRARFFALC